MRELGCRCDAFADERKTPTWTAIRPGDLMDWRRGDRCGVTGRRRTRLGAVPLAVTVPTTLWDAAGSWRTRLGAALLAVAALPVLSVAAAADETYVRVGAGIDRSTGARFTDADCATHGLYGCGNGSDGAPHSTFGDFGASAGVEVGLGRRVAPALRIEGIVQFRPRATYEGRANFLASDRRQSVSAGLSAVSGLAVMYADLTELGLPGLGRFHPFAGGDAGISRIALDETTMTLYALMSFTVARRTREIGVRIALGGKSSRIVASIARRSLLQLMFGVMLGTGFWAIVFTRLTAIGAFRGELGVAVQSWPYMLSITAAIVLTTGLLACLAPTLRGLRIRPVEALRVDS